MTASDLHSLAVAMPNQGSLERGKAMTTSTMAAPVDLDARYEALYGATCEMQSRLADAYAERRGAEELYESLHYEMPDGPTTQLLAKLTRRVDRRVKALCRIDAARQAAHVARMGDHCVYCGRTGGQHRHGCVFA